MNGESRKLSKNEIRELMDMVRDTIVMTFGAEDYGDEKETDNSLVVKEALEQTLYWIQRIALKQEIEKLMDEKGMTDPNEILKDLMEHSLDHLDCAGFMIGEVEETVDYIKHEREEAEKPYRGLKF